MLSKRSCCGAAMGSRRWAQQHPPVGAQGAPAAPQLLLLQEHVALHPHRAAYQIPFQAQCQCCGAAPPRSPPWDALTPGHRCWVPTALRCAVLCCALAAPTGVSRLQHCCSLPAAPTITQQPREWLGAARSLSSTICPCTARLTLGRAGGERWQHAEGHPLQAVPAAAASMDTLLGCTHLAHLGPHAGAPRQLHAPLCAGAYFGELKSLALRL